jgi:putative oxidoreductase
MTAPYPVFKPASLPDFQNANDTFARVASGAIALLMVGAIAMVHAHFGFYMNWFGQQKGEGFEYHLLAIGLAVAVLVRGAGSFSIDGLLSKSTARA